MREPSSYESSERSVPDRFESFNLSIERIDETYRAKVTASPVGQRQALEIDSTGLMGGAQSAPGDDAVTTREVRRQPTEIGDLRRLGEQLFKSVFVGPIAEAFRASIERTRHDGVGLRVCLQLDEAPELAPLPWEALWDPGGRVFFADQNSLPVVRTLGVAAEAPELVPAEAPLRVLGLLPEPQGEGKLSGVTEWQQIREHLAPLVERDELRAELLEPPTLKALGDRIDQAPCHVLHIVAHGGPGDRGAGGLLKLEDASGQTDSVSGGDLARALERRAAPRLVVLSACHGARAAVDDAFDGMAQHLLSRGVPAVVAMRTAISDKAAVSFATALYRELAGGRSVERAMVNARRALSLGQHRTEWATPVLYLRGDNVRILKSDVLTRSTSRRDSGRGLRKALIFATACAVGFLAIWLWRSFVSGDPISAECPPPFGLQDLRFVKVKPGMISIGDRIVRVDEAFCIATKEVSRRDWATIMGPDLLRREWPPAWPMTDVTPEDALAFLETLEAQKSGVVYRLPTADEWEFAARAGQTTDYFFGDEPTELDRFGNCHNVLGSDCHDGPAPVGSYQPNDWGLYDVHGNVEEWTQWPEDAGSPVDENGQQLAMRLGGSFDNTPGNCNFFRRSPVRADVTNRNDTGFRPIRELTTEEER